MFTKFKISTIILCTIMLGAETALVGDLQVRGKLIHQTTGQTATVFNRSCIEFNYNNVSQRYTL